MEIEVGDFIAGHDNQIYEIITISQDGTNLFYELKKVDDPGQMFESPAGGSDILLTTTIMVPRNQLRHMGTLIKKEESAKVIDILFKE